MESRELDLNLLPNTIIQLRFLPEDEISLSHMLVNNRLTVRDSTEVRLMLYMMEILIAEVYLVHSDHRILFPRVLALLWTHRLDLLVRIFVSFPSLYF